jgi:hypothetical protein
MRFQRSPSPFPWFKEAFPMLLFGMEILRNHLLMDVIMFLKQKHTEIPL